MKTETIGQIVILSVCVLMSFLIGGALIEYRMVNQAIEKGYAEHYRDECNYKHWRWK